jgi:hypothetical protein
VWAMSSGSAGWRFSPCHSRDHGYTGTGSVTGRWTTSGLPVSWVLEANMIRSGEAAMRSMMWSRPKTGPDVSMVTPNSALKNR